MKRAKTIAAVIAAAALLGGLIYLYKSGMLMRIDWRAAVI